MGDTIMKEFKTVADLEASKQTVSDLMLYCRENSLYYIVQDAGYTPTGDDVTFTNGRVGKAVFIADAKYIKTRSGNVQSELDSIVSGGLPSQTGNQFKFLSTDGTDAQWSNGQIEVATFAALEALAPEAGGLVFICQGRANAKYILQPITYIALPGDVTFANGRVGALQVVDGAYHLQHFGAIGDGVTLNTSALIGFFSRLSDVNSPSATGHIGDGIYLTDEVGQINVYRDITIRASNGATIKANSGINRMLWFRATQQTYRKRGLTWTGGTIDNSDANYIPASLSGEGMVIQELGKCVIQNVLFQGPEDYEVGKSDSGLLPQDCLDVSVTGCTFRGQNDEGIYILKTDSIKVTDCRFEKCWSGIRYSKDGNQGLFTNNIFDKCRGGMLIAETSGGRSGAHVIISGNLFFDMKSRAIDFRMGEMGDCISNNVIVDWGYNLDGTRDDSGFAAIQIFGSERLLVSDNVINMYSREGDANHVAIRVANFSFNDEVLYTTNCTIQGNSIDGGTILSSGSTSTIGFGIQENNGNDGNSYTWNRIKNADVKIDIPTGNALTSKYDEDSLGPINIKRLPATAQGIRIESTGSGNKIYGVCDTGNPKVFEVSSDENSIRMDLSAESGPVRMLAEGRRIEVDGDTGLTGGSGTAGGGNQYVTLKINGTNYKLLHDGTF